LLSPCFSIKLVDTVSISSLFHITCPIISLPLFGTAYARRKKVKEEKEEAASTFSFLAPYYNYYQYGMDHNTTFEWTQVSTATHIVISWRIEKGSTYSSKDMWALKEIKIYRGAANLICVVILKRICILLFFSDNTTVYW